MRKAAAALFTVCAAIYVYHACGAVAPFRDAGEFAVAAQRLSVAHPPGYPFFVLLSRAWIDFVPWGNVSYRLNALSALAACGSGFLFVAWCARGYGIGVIPAGIAAAALMSARPILGLSFVSEMYTLGLLGLLAVLYWIHEINEKPSRLLLAGFIFPFVLGTRMDLALTAIYAAPFVPGWVRFRRRHFLAAWAFVTVGFGVFGYMLIRSRGEPLVNWGDPSTMAAFINSVIRKSYGSTVDLLSKSYVSGELFWLDIRHWLKVLWETFGPFLAVIPMGWIFLLVRRQFWPSFFCWVVTGPLFLYMANLPPNPHAFKILEDHFLPSFLMAGFWIAAGLQWLFVKIETQCSSVVNLKRVQIFILPMIPLFLWLRMEPWGLRNNFYAYDYALNLMRSLPRGAAAVLHDDVQLFAAWEAHLNRGRRPDLRIVAQGLSGTLWYQNCLKNRWGYDNMILPSKLETPEAWRSFMTANGHLNVFAGFETEINADFVRRFSHGLAGRLCLEKDAFCAGALAQDLWPFLILRGPYRAHEEHFFFNQDIVEDYSRASFELGALWAREPGRRDQGLRYLKKALVMRLIYPQPAIGLAYEATSREDWPQAERWWRQSRRKIDQMLELAQEYRSLPDAVISLRQEKAYVLTSLGVARERQGAPLEEIARLHQEAAQADSSNVIAHYNLAATYWRQKNGPGAFQEFQTVLRLDPNHEEAKKYLALLTGALK
ncbi:MAG: DUF2723 domain-containing protein [Elusimicrobia bacterium]|nr:DUF2723 domain-containing protein [Elusimicrobiota bacterium]